MSEKAFITGVTGQDGSYLTEFLLERGYEVHGMVRRTSAISRSRLQHLYSDPSIYGKRLFLHYAELDDPTTLRRLLVKLKPSEIYHLAGQSHVGLSFEIAESTCEMTAMGTLRLLEIIRDLPVQPRFYHAASSEMFGQPASAPQDENTPFAPVNPYGCAKAFATRMVAIYRSVYGMFACNGITFNHESPRRGENFVTRKICRAAAAIKLGLEKELLLGDLQSERDWGDARDFVRGFWLALRHPVAEDFVFATGILHKVSDIAEISFGFAGLDWRSHIRQDPRFIRPAEPLRLVGNAAKARSLLGWAPSVTFEEMIREMTQCELDALARQKSGAERPRLAATT
jgi:GDPmannose 4,6-dehydratase